MRPFNSSNCDDLGCLSRSFIDYKLFSILVSASRGPSAIAELLVRDRVKLRRSNLAYSLVLVVTGVIYGRNV